MRSNRKIKNICTMIGFLVFSVFLTFNHVTVDATSTLSQDTLELTEVGSQLTKLTYGLDTELYDNQFIQTDLLTPTFSDVEVGDELTVKYNVQIPDLYQSESEEYDEVIIMIDVSNNMSIESWNAIQTFFTTYFEKSVQSSKLKIGIIPYYATVDYGQEKFVQLFDNELLDLTKSESVEKIKNAFLANDAYGNEKKYPLMYQGGRAALDNALRIARDLFDKGFKEDKKQAVILITSDMCKVNDGKWFKTFANEQRRVISINTGTKMNNMQRITDGEATYTSAEIHQHLYGDVDDYIEASGEQIISALTSTFQSLTGKTDANQKLLDKKSVVYNQNNTVFLPLTNMDQIVMAIDGSQNMYTTNNNYPTRWLAVKEFIVNYLQNSSLKNQVELGILPFAGASIDTQNIPININQLYQLNSDNIFNIRETFRQNFIFATEYYSNNNIWDILNNIIGGNGMMKPNIDNQQAVIVISSGGYQYYTDTLFEEFRRSGYRIITLDFGDKIDGYNVSAQEIHNQLGGKSEDYIAVENETMLLQILKYMFNVSEKPETDGSGQQPISELNLMFDLGGNFETIEGLNENGVYHIDEITYRVEDGKYIYEPMEVEFKVRIKEVESSFTFDSAQVAYKYASDTFTLQEITKPLFNSVSNDYKIKMKVSDSAATIVDEYNYPVNAADYTISNLDSTYKLYGKSKVIVDFEGTDLTHLRYQFVKEGEDLTDDWKYISATNDVKENEAGYLTQMPYDVSHMDLLSNTTKWSNRQEVFKTAFADKTGPISMKVSPAHNHNASCTSDTNHYVTAEQVVNQNGDTVTRYVPKTLFVQNHNVGSYAPQYKEASKTWGYIKVPTTGDYWFRTYSDDGFYGVITVDGKQQIIGEDFKPRGSSAIDSKESIRLEAGKYYPIYLEYFNWGGSADYRIMYSINNKNNFQIISDQWFFPSNSDEPTDGSNNIFMGSSTINFVDEPGVYKIYYEVGTKSEDSFDVKSAGSYGNFEIEERFNLIKELSLEKVDLNETFILTYTLMPKSIKVTDLYKVSSIELINASLPNTLTIQNIELRDTLPEGIISLDNASSSTINREISEIVYKLRGNEYVADIQSQIINIKAASKDVIFEDGSGELHYRDVSLVESLRISQKQRFIEIPELEVYDNSLIESHGLFNGKTVINGSYNVVSTMNYHFGFMINARGLNNNFTVNIPIDVKLDLDKVYLYEVDGDGNVVLESKQKLTTDGITIRFEDDKSNPLIQNGKKYIVTYLSNNILKDSIIKATLDTGSYEDLKLTIQTDLPDLL